MFEGQTMGILSADQADLETIGMMMAGATAESLLEEA
jgi:hypothetical protein